MALKEYHNGTRAIFKPVDSSLTRELLSASDRKRIGDILTLSSGRQFVLDHVSIGKNGFFRSRSFSMYFREKGKKSVIRISDHWSSSNHNERSNKLNCGYIRSCHWSIDNREEDKIHYHGKYSGKYPWVLMAGVCSLKGFETIEQNTAA